MINPEQLGKYPITGILGRGAMGVVYKAYDPLINRVVAIKTIHKRLIGQDLSGSSIADRFRNEAQAVGRVSHPGIVAIYEYGEDDNTAYIVMEYVEGRTLSKILSLTPRLPERDILRLMDQLLDALDCAHRNRVWHRDIKPANLIVTDKGQLKITDFGIARIDAAPLTQVSSSIGTPGYMAPEQYSGEALDHRMDIFACGVLLYGMLAGEPPFRGSPETVMYKALNIEPVPPSQIPIAPRPAFYDAIVAKAMAKSPDHRYSNAAQFRHALSQRVLPHFDEDPQTTVIEVLPGAASRPPSSVAAEERTTPQTTGPWDATTLAQLELTLASCVGPVAKVLVRQAARTCTDLASLQAALGKQILSDEDRQRFMAKMAATTGNYAAHKTTLTPTISGAMPKGEVLSAELKEQASKVLTRHMGPIASIMIKKAAAKATSPAQFIQLLAEQVTEGPDRERLVNELRRYL